MKYLRIMVTGFAFCLLLSGCASQSFFAGPSSEPPTEKASTGWWNIRFTINWPENENPSWHVDLALAHQVISPVLEKYSQDISLWRFHRRAVRDRAGHQFTFVFYGPQKKAQEISQMVASNPALNVLKKAGVIIEDSYDTSQYNVKTKTEESSDASWSLPVQKSWPFYIMGVSKTWLHLVKDFAQQASEAKVPSAAQEMLAYYEGISEAIDKAWREEGGHAFLHHLNAIFGYQDVVIFERKLMNF